MVHPAHGEVTELRGSSPLPFLSIHSTKTPAAWEAQPRGRDEMGIPGSGAGLLT